MELSKSWWAEVTRTRRCEWRDVFELRGARSEVPAARRKVSCALQALGLRGSALFDLRLAVSEALNNAVRHGSPRKEPGDVVVRVGTAPGAVVVEVSDRGHGLDSARICPPGTDEQSGRGIPTMRALADDLRIDCDERGTTVFLAKRVPA